MSLRSIMQAVSEIGNIYQDMRTERKAVQQALDTASAMRMENPRARIQRVHPDQIVKTEKGSGVLVIDNGAARKMFRVKTQS